MIVVVLDTCRAALLKLSAQKPMILKGWKDIAKYLGCGVRTVQRWERLSLPVRRPARSKRSPVVAISKELEAWIKRRSPIAPSVASEEMTSPSRAFRYRILLADDNEAFLVTLASQLSAEGYDVRTARDGFEALALMHEGVPDLIVSDLKMNNMSGFELFSVVRQRFPGIAVIAHSGEFVAAGNPIPLCDKHIEKGPNSRFELLEAIRDLLSQSPLRPQPAKVEVAPAWIPRSMNGYFVLTCRDCLRSFSVLTRDGAIGRDAIAKCSHCGVDVKYHIDDSVLPVQEDLREFVKYSNARIAATQRGIVRGSKRRAESARRGKS